VATEISVSVQDAKVVYTTKELLERIDKRFDRLEDFAANAATRSDVVALEGRVSALEQDASGTKAVAKALLEDGKNRWSKNEKIAGMLVGLVAVAPSVAALAHLFN
jgi:hypothetical protein